MDAGTIALISLGVAFGIIFIIVFLSIWLRTINVVPPNEAHVVVTKNKRQLFDGQGRYHFYKLFNRRIIVPKEVLDIEIPDIRLHDKDKLPFMVKISCKVQVKDPAKAAETLGSGVFERVKKIADDTVQSCTRTTCMQKDILTIMIEREEIEASIYNTLAKSFIKLGFEPIIFDIKDLKDSPESFVIKNLERVKSAELDKDARISEASNDALAKKIESEKHKDAQVMQEQMSQDENEAKIIKEKFIAEQTEDLVKKKMIVQELEVKRAAEIEREKEIIIANAKADSIRIQAAAEAEAIQLKAEAEAAGISAKAKALDDAGEKGIKMKSLETIIEGLVQSSKEISNGLKLNSKVIIMGGGDSKSNSLMSLIPMAEFLKESEIIKNIVKEFKPTED